MRKHLFASTHFVSTHETEQAASRYMDLRSHFPLKFESKISNIFAISISCSWSYSYSKFIFNLLTGKKTTLSEKHEWFVNLPKTKSSWQFVHFTVLQWSEMMFSYALCSIISWFDTFSNSLRIFEVLFLQMFQHF